MHTHNATLAHGSIALIGHPNVGKSVIFQKLTGLKTIVSNYPGTTVEVTSGQLRERPSVRLVDTPGVGSWPPQTEDERLAAAILLREDIDGVIQVGDAKNLSRTLALSAVLIELGIPMVLALNMMDEANAAGMQIEEKTLSDLISIPVAATTATRGKGIEELQTAVKEAKGGQLDIPYPTDIEAGIDAIQRLLPKTGLRPRGAALLFLGGLDEIDQSIRENSDDDSWAKMVKIRQDLEARGEESLPVRMQMARINFAETTAAQVIRFTNGRNDRLAEKVGALAIHPFWGLVILATVMGGLYWFVGVFGAQTLVALLEDRLFGELINPWMSNMVLKWISIPWMQEFLTGEYGIWTMGFTYAAALIFPIVTTFFMAFSVIEDSGYLPRLATLSNGFFQRLGLNGKAILPMVLGLGCVTMATLTTRTLDTRRERLIVTLLLALAIPCSAQLGIVLGMLASLSVQAVLLWSGFILAVLLIVGKLASHIAPGERSGFMVELAPIRKPLFSNVMMKTLGRLEWYLKEVLPIFLAGAALMFLLDRMGGLGWLIQTGEPIVSGWLGLPEEATSAFVLGFLRRDFGATGLFAMNSAGMLTATQMLVAMITMTLFIPCIASVFIIAKEYGWKTAAAMTAIVIPTALLAGGGARLGLEMLNFG